MKQFEEDMQRLGFKRRESRSKEVFYETEYDDVYIYYCHRQIGTVYEAFNQKTKNSFLFSREFMIEAEEYLRNALKEISTKQEEPK